MACSGSHSAASTRGTLTDARRSRCLRHLWEDTQSGEEAWPKSMSFRQLGKCSSNAAVLTTTDPGDLVLDPTCGSGTTAYVAEAVGPPLDHDRHLPRCAGARPVPHHGCTLPILPSRRQCRGPAQGSRTLPQGAARIPGPTAISARASCTSASRTSRSSPSPTTPRSTRSTSRGNLPVEESLAALNDALKDHPAPFAVADGGAQGREGGLHRPGKHDGHSSFR